MKADRIADPWGARMPYRRHEAWPTRVDSYLAEGDLSAESDPRALARYVMTVQQGMSVQAAGGATREDLLAVADMALRAWPG
mgnify:CR=1 FL=1